VGSRLRGVNGMVRTLFALVIAFSCGCACNVRSSMIPKLSGIWVLCGTEMVDLIPKTGEAIYLSESGSGMLLRGKEEGGFRFNMSACGQEVHWRSNGFGSSPVIVRKGTSGADALVLKLPGRERESEYTLYASTIPTQLREALGLR
jgi:hypothetical protein